MLLRDLAIPVTPIHADTTGADVYERFHAEPDTLSIAIVDDHDAPLGIVERNAFFLAMASQFGRALYAGRPITALMNASPLVGEGDLAVADFCRLVLAERPSELLQGFIVLEAGRYVGLGSALCLLQATNAANKRHAEEMTCLAATLERAKLEAQSALTAKSQFLAVMSHEIRTPLNGVLAVAEILDRKLTAPDLQPYVGAILESGQTLLRLLGDVLDLSRAEAGRLELDEEPFLIPALLDDLAALWGPRAELKGLTFVLSYDGPPEQWALGDAVRLKQVLNNLIGNALKFTLAGAVEVTLRARREGCVIQLQGEVRDSGVGIAPDRLASVFEPFNQTEAGARFGGAGLGLSICRQLVGQMDGAIEARCNTGVGTTLTFEVPLYDVPAPAAQAPAPAVALDAEGPRLHVLIADDNATNRLVAETLCEMFGMTSQSVADGQEAVAAAREGRFDLILMDIKMPNLDGLGATRAIRAMPGAAGDVPILALTANADPWDAAAYLAQGMDGVVEKPLKVERLIEAVNEALRRPAAAARSAA